MVPSHTVHLPLGALLTWCTMCGTGGLAADAPPTPSSLVVVTALATLQGDREEAIGVLGDRGRSLGGDGAAVLSALEEVHGNRQ